MASILALTICVFFLASCHKKNDKISALVEANPISAGMYHIEIIADNGLAELAYSSNVLSKNDCACWTGSATVGAYKMAFRQECHSLYFEGISAKQWRGKWVRSQATDPSLQIAAWFAATASQGCAYNASPVLAASALPLNEGDTRTAVTVVIPAAPMQWEALCDANIDSYFGTQAILTDAETCIVFLYFNAESNAFIGATFTADTGQTTIRGSITVSTTDGHTLPEMPIPELVETIKDGLLEEQWEILQD